MGLYRNSLFFLTFLFPPFHDLFLSLGSLKNLGLTDIVPCGEKARKGKIHVTDFILFHGMFVCEESLSKCVSHSRCLIYTALFISPSSPFYRGFFGVVVLLFKSKISHLILLYIFYRI